MPSEQDGSMLFLDELARGFRANDPIPPVIRTRMLRLRFPICSLCFAPRSFHFGPSGDVSSIGGALKAAIMSGSI
jgi:hypothetical protein